MNKHFAFTLLAGCFSVAVFPQDKTIETNNEVNERAVRTIPIKKLDKEVVIDQRTEKYWGNGQKATPTGRQATGIGSGYSALRKNQPVKIVSPSSSISTYSINIPENRNIYMWDNGQKATITGFQATGIGSGYSAIKKNYNYRDKLKKSNTRINEGNSSTLIENRRIKLWPDGQKATVTGHEATPINGGYSSLRKKKSWQNDQIVNEH